MRNYHNIKLWEDVSDEQWGDWHWQLQNSVTTLEELEQIVHLSESERCGVIASTKYLKMKISPHLAILMDPDDSKDPLRKQFIPSIQELASIEDVLLFADVNADDQFTPTEGLVHRYPTKVLLFPSNYCGAYCRYCFRRKLVRDFEKTLNAANLEQIFSYISKNPKIEEVILSGGDPLVLDDKKLGFILESVARIPHVDILRLHTRIPVSVPHRITQNLVDLLVEYKPVYVVIHIDTIREVTDPTREAITRLVDNGIPCLASCPLLKGVNDSEDELRVLWTELVKLRVKPYYLFHSDPVKGSKHFLVPMSRGLEIMRNLYDRMSGLAMPHYCFNVPGGGGHVLLNYNYVTRVSEGHYQITNFEGEQLEYFEDVD